MSASPANSVADPVAEYERWLEYELKIREFHHRTFLDFLKLSTDFSRLVISGLVAANSGGLIALPALALFFGLDKEPLATKTAIFIEPALLYAAGFLCALLCSLGSYFNFKDLGHSHLLQIDVAMLSARKERAKMLGLSDLEAITKDLGVAQAATKRFKPRISISYYASHSLGWISMACFILGSGFLLFHHSG